MASNNDITGDKIQTKVPSKSYRDNWDKIFKKENKNAPCGSREADKDNR